MNPELLSQLSTILNAFDLKKLQKASFALSACYLKGGSLTREEELIAYLAVRLPATYAVLKRVLACVQPGTLLDLGAGPGTACWVAQELWGDRVQVTSIEREYKFIELGKKLITPTKWINANILTLESFEPHDWILFSYSLAEISSKNFAQLLEKSWKAAHRGIIIVEPGTPASFQRILLLRDLLIALGATIIAPCPHHHTCPLKSNDWCHFSVRLERSFFHRYSKLGTLSFENEKFTYLIATKQSQGEPKARILRPPEHHKGHITFNLCTASGLQKLTLSRRQKEIYKQARKLEWGDTIDAV